MLHPLRPARSDEPDPGNWYSDAVEFHTPRCPSFLSLAPRPASLRIPPKPLVDPRAVRLLTSTRSHAVTNGSTLASGP
ncbi:hypothetical protein B0H17DRAFT_1040267 [Mycena rosella]|uniref:Uncharacterized protein n=1 Tax=Mycena rosella TaxID=1033263 RepID=A0AAD7GS01_MYCRO|nr:hypothetical protein B0H17DRAFT_1040267 [Mycena rosella]